MNKLPENWGKGNTKKPFNKDNSPYNKPPAAVNEPQRTVEKAQTEPPAADPVVKPSAKPFVKPEIQQPQPTKTVNTAQCEPAKKAEPKAVPSKPVPKQKTKKADKSKTADNSNRKKYAIFICAGLAVIAVAVCLVLMLNHGTDYKNENDLLQESSNPNGTETSFDNNDTQVNGSQNNSLPDVSEPEVSEPEVSELDVSQPDVSQPDVSQPDVSQPDVSQPDVSQPDVSEPVYDTTINNTCPECKRSVEYVDGDVWLSCYDCYRIFPANENPIYSCSDCERHGLYAYMLNTDGKMCRECTDGKTDYDKCLYCSKGKDIVYIDAKGSCTACIFSGYEGVHDCDNCMKPIKLADAKKYDGFTCPDCARCEQCYSDLTPEEYLEAQAFLCKSCYDASRGIYYGECEICNAPLNLRTSQDYNGKRCRQCANCIYCGNYIWQSFYEETGDFICPICFEEHNSQSSTWYSYICTVCGGEIHTSTYCDPQHYVCPTCDETPNVFCPECGNSWHTTGVGIDGFYCGECGHNWIP